MGTTVVSKGDAAGPQPQLRWWNTALRAPLECPLEYPWSTPGCTGRLEKLNQLNPLHSLDAEQQKALLHDLQSTYSAFYAILNQRK